jgi:hypothetical protein
LQLRVNADSLAVLNHWRMKQPDAPSHSEAIRQLVSVAIAREKKGKK